MFHLGRHIYFLIPLICDVLWQKIKQTAGGLRPKWSILGYLAWAQRRVQQLKAEIKNETTTFEQKVKPVIATFMEGKLSDSDNTYSALAQQGMAAWSGGWETVGTTVTLATCEVLKNAKMAARLKHELRSVWPDINRPPSMDPLDSSLYLTAVIKEAVRLTPPPGGLSRYNPNETKHDKNYSFPPGTIISTSLPMMLQYPSIWGADAEVFRPERWIGKENDHGELDQWLVSFSKRTRICPGLEVAWFEMRLLLAHAFRKFDLSFNEKAKVTDDDILTYRDGFTGIPKNWSQRLPVWAKPVMD